jgi:dTDP-4-dehydrorhamnose 3,5-epimerase
MRFEPAGLQGAFVVELEEHEDERGSFARTWCRSEFAAAGLATEFVQGNTAVTHRRGTIRGMHHQLPPHDEAKLVRCIRGGIWDVLMDLRPDSPTFQQWVGLELTEENRKMLYVPEGCAHGYQTLLDDSEVFYLVSAFYAPEAERGVRFDDPAFGIEWPLPPREISEKDRGWPPFRPREGNASRGRGESVNRVRS